MVHRLRNVSVQNSSFNRCFEPTMALNMRCKRTCMCEHNGTSTVSGLRKITIEGFC